MLVDFYNPSGEGRPHGPLRARMAKCITVPHHPRTQLPWYRGVWGLRCTPAPHARGRRVVRLRPAHPLRLHWLLAIYLTVMLGVTFITQQVHWSQFRLVIIYLPFLLAFFLNGLHIVFAKRPHDWGPP